MADISPAFALKEKVESLKQMMLDRHPKMPTLLSEIHKTLLKYPEQVVLMSEEETAIVVQGLIKQTGTEFAKAAMKTSSTSAKSLAAKIASGTLEL